MEINCLRNAGIFVCRLTGIVSRRTIAGTSEEIAQLVSKDLDQLVAGKIKPTFGDTRCITFGHLVRLSIWNLRRKWNKDLPTSEKLIAVAKAIDKLGGWVGVETYLSDVLSSIPHRQKSFVFEEQASYGGELDEISF